MCKLNPTEFVSANWIPQSFLHFSAIPHSTWTSSVHTYLSFTQEGQILCADFCNSSKRTIAISTVSFKMQEEFKASKQKQPIGFAQGCVVCLWIEAGERSMPTNMSNKRKWRKERDITWMRIRICSSSPSSPTSGADFSDTIQETTRRW